MSMMPAMQHFLTRQEFFPRSSLVILDTTPSHILAIFSVILVNAGCCDEGLLRIGAAAGSPKRVCCMLAQRGLSLTHPPQKGDFVLKTAISSLKRRFRPQKVISSSKQ